MAYTSAAILIKLEKYHQNVKTKNGGEVRSPEKQFIIEMLHENF